MPVILALQSNPDDQMKLELDLEVREIRNATDPFARRDLEIIHVGAVNINEILLNLLEHQPDIFHFCGHGAENGNLIFLDNGRNSQEINIAAIETLFKYLGASIKCVVLSCCYSKKQAARIAKYVPFVIGNSSEVRDDLSIMFTRNFYCSLSYGKSIPEAFNIAATMVRSVDQSRINKPSIKLGPTLDEKDSIIFTKPVVKACFFLNNNKKPQKNNRDEFKIKIWVDHLPKKTLSVVYNFNHDTVLDNIIEVINDGTGTDTWTRLYGNIQLRITIWFANEGIGIEKSLVEALHNYYRGKKLSPAIKAALHQIETN